VWLEGCKFSDFKLGPILGTGSFGRVHLAHYIPTNQVCASKSLSKAMIVKSKQASYILSNQLGNLLPFSFVEIMSCNAAI
jgi:protein kinase A